MKGYGIRRDGFGKKFIYILRKGFIVCFGILSVESLSGFGVLEMLKQALHVNKRIVQSTSAEAFLKNKRCLFIKGDSSIKFK